MLTATLAHQMQLTLAILAILDIMLVVLIHAHSVTVL